MLVVDFGVVVLIAIFVALLASALGFSQRIAIVASLALAWAYLAALKAGPKGTVGYRLAGVQLVNLQGRPAGLLCSTYRFLLLFIGPLHLRSCLRPGFTRYGTSACSPPQRSGGHWWCPSHSPAKSLTTTAPCGPTPCSATPRATGSRYRPWAELLRRIFAVDVETCPRWGGRMRLMALITEPQSVQRFLRHRGEPTEPPARAPPREAPYFKTLVVRRRPTSERSQQGELFEEH